MAWPGAAGERATRGAPSGSPWGAPHSCIYSRRIIRRRPKQPSPGALARGGLTAEVTQASHGILLHNNLSCASSLPCYSLFVDTARYAKDLVIVMGSRRLCLAGDAVRGAA